MNPQTAAYLITGGNYFRDAVCLTLKEASDRTVSRTDGSAIVELVRSDEAAKAAGEMAHKLAEAEAEVASLRAFAQGVMQRWPLELQDIAIKNGLLTPVQVAAPCSENCSCSEFLSPEDYPATCYRNTPLLTGPETAP